MTHLNVGAVIPTKNSEAIIRGALESLWFCNEISVVDMFSTDRTKAICSEYANVKFYEKEGFIYENFNYGLDQLEVEWVIRLDSDERLSPELQQEIIDLLSSQPKADVYTAIHRPYYLGRPMFCGTAAEKNRRYILFRNKTMRYKVHSEHEELSPTSDEPIKLQELQNYYAHFAIPHLSKVLQRLDYYTECDYNRLKPEVITVLPPWRLMIAIPKMFLKYYFLRKGYREGYHGFCECAMNAVYSLVHNLKGWEHHGRWREKHRQAVEEFDEKIKQFRHSYLVDQ